MRYVEFDDVICFLTGTKAQPAEGPEVDPFHEKSAAIFSDVDRARLKMTLPSHFD